MSFKSTFSLSGDNYLLNKAEISLDFSFDEKDFKISNLSPSTLFSTTTVECKQKLININLILILFFFVKL